MTDEQATTTAGCGCGDTCQCGPDCQCGPECSCHTADAEATDQHAAECPCGPDCQCGPDCLPPRR